MTIRVLLFAQLADVVGSREISIDVPEGSTVADALAAIDKAYPAVVAFKDRVAVAVAEAYAPSDQVIEPGQTLALIPPVSGG